MSEETQGKQNPEAQGEPLPLAREEYDPGKLNDLTYEQELQCWYNYTYRGNQEKEWTLKVFIMGTLLACLMVLINIYMGLKTGWGEGGSIIAVLLTFLFLSIIVRTGVIKSYGILETNMIQTMASAGGSLGNLVNVVPALLLMGYALNWYDMFCLIFTMSFMGVLFAIPLRRQNVIIEKLKFPTGTACYQTIKAVHEKTPQARLQGMALAISLGCTMFFTFLRDFMPKIKGWIPDTHEMKRKIIDYLTVPEGTHLSHDKFLTNVNYGVEWSPLLFGIGFMTGPRVGFGMLLGGVVGFIFLPKYLLEWGYIGQVNSWKDVSNWLMWPSTSFLVGASFVVIGFKLPVIMRAFRGLSGKAAAAMSGLEVPRKVYWVLMGASVFAALIFMSTRFDIPVFMGLFAIVLSFLLAMIAVRSAGETDINPVGAMGHVTQIAYGAAFNCTPRGNLGASGLTASGASEAGDMMQDLKTGYLLGATPKRQVYIELLGVFIGSIVAVVLLYALLYDKDGAMTIREKVALKTDEEKKVAKPSHLLSTENIQDIEGLIAELKTPDNALAVHLREKIALPSLDEYNDANAPSEKLQKDFIEAMNGVLKGECLYQKERFAGIVLSEATLKQVEAGAKGDELIALNRELLSSAYPKYIEKFHTFTSHPPEYPAPAAFVWRNLAIAMSSADALFRINEIRDMTALTAEITEAKTPLAKHIKENFTPYVQSLLKNYEPGTTVPRPLQPVVVEQLNQVLRRHLLHSDEYFAGVELREETTNLLKENAPDKRVIINRFLLEDAYPQAIRKFTLPCSDDYKDIGKLATALRDAGDPLSEYLKSRLSQETRTLLEKFQNAPISRKLQNLLIEDMDRILEGKCVYDEKIFEKVVVSAGSKELAGQKLEGTKLILLNRDLLQQAYPDAIEKSHGGLAKGAFWGVLIGAILGIFFGVLEQTKLRRWLPSTIGLGISLIIPLSYSISIFLGSVAQFVVLKARPNSQDLIGPIAAGTIAGEPIVGTLARAPIF